MSGGAAPAEKTEEAVGAVLDRSAFNRALLDSVGIGLVIADPESRAILFHNRRFLDLFPELPANATIDQVITVPGSEDFADNDVVIREQEIKIKRRKASLLIHFSSHSLPEGEVLMVECHNVSKIKELEYMIESYSKMVEKNARDLRREKERAERCSSTSCRSRSTRS